MLEISGKLSIVTLRGQYTGCLRNIVTDVQPQLTQSYLTINWKDKYSIYPE